MEDGTRKDVKEIHLFDTDEQAMWLSRCLLAEESPDQKSIVQLMVEYGSDHEKLQLHACQEKPETWFKVVIEDHSVPTTSQERFILRSVVKNYLSSNGYGKDLPGAQKAGFYVDCSTISAPFKFWELLCAKIL